MNCLKSSYGKVKLANDEWSHKKRTMLLIISMDLCITLGYISNTEHLQDILDDPSYAGPQMTNASVRPARGSITLQGSAAFMKS